MSQSNAHPCPICSSPVFHQERYPQSVCSNCFNKASDRAGRKLCFSNMGFGGGYKAIVEKAEEEYNSHICYIDGIKCTASEARFGGIVIKIAKL